MAILKPGEFSYSYSYWLISLLKVDIKLIANMMAICFITVINTVIIPDQAYFMPNKSTALKIQYTFITFTKTSRKHRN